MTRVIGVDACKRGWVGITSDLCGYFGSTVAELVELADRDGTLDVVAIDIPIGLPATGPRQADVVARGLVGKRASSVFPTPIRAALQAQTHAEGSLISVAATGKGVSAQAFALGRKILEVDAWLRGLDRTVIEVHPEVSFAIMAGRPLSHPKSTWAGSQERRALLRTAGINIPDDLGIAGERAGADDVLDAAAAQWTAARHAKGVAIALPEEPERFDNEPASAIWA